MVRNVSLVQQRTHSNDIYNRTREGSAKFGGRFYCLGPLQAIAQCQHFRLCLLQLVADDLPGAPVLVKENCNVQVNPAQKSRKEMRDIGAVTSSDVRRSSGQFLCPLGNASITNGALSLKAMEYRRTNELGPERPEMRV